MFMAATQNLITVILCDAHNALELEQQNPSTTHSIKLYPSAVHWTNLFLVLALRLVRCSTFKLHYLEPILVGTGFGDETSGYSEVLGYSLSFLVLSIVPTYWILVVVPL